MLLHPQTSQRQDRSNQVIDGAFRLTGELWQGAPFTLVGVCANPRVYQIPACERMHRRP